MPSFNMKAKGKKAKMYIYQDIGENWFGDGLTAKKFIDSLNALGDDVDHIDAHINSRGGSVFDGLAIYNALKQHKASVTVYIDGLAASIASVIAMAGDKIIMPANSMMMVHNVWSCVCGDHRDMRKTADDIEMMTKSIITTYVARTGQNKTQITELLNSETWLDADQAKELGFCDEVDESSQMAAMAGIDLSIFKNTPRHLQNYELPAVASAKPVKTSQEEPETMPMNLDELKEKHPEIYNAAIEEGKKQAAAAAPAPQPAKPEDDAAKNAVQAERDRVAGIDKIAFKGNEELVAECKANGTSVADFAIKQAEVEKAKGSNMLQTLQNEAPKPVPAQNSATGELPEASAEEDEDGEPDPKAEDAKMRAEYKKDTQGFGTFEGFKGWMKAVAAGRVGPGVQRK